MEDLGLIPSRDDKSSLHQIFHPETKTLHRTNSSYRGLPAQIQMKTPEIEQMPTLIPSTTMHCLGDGLRDKFLQGGKCPFKRNRHAVSNPLD
jgi:hypothetical protein